MYYLVNALIITVYLLIDRREEPIAQSLSAAAVCGVCLAVASLAANFLHPRWKSQISMLRNQGRQMAFEFFLYVLAALVFSLVEIRFFHTEFLPVAKAVVAVLSTGAYAAVGAALRWEHRCITDRVPVTIGDSSRVVPALIRFRYFLATVLWVGFAFLASEAYLHLGSQSESVRWSSSSPEHAFQEIVFVSAVVLGWSIHLVNLYSRNLWCVLGMQLEILRHVEKGFCDLSVPIVSEDESGLLAKYSNILIERLRDRERLYDILEKSVGPNVMKKLLNTDERTLKRGQHHDVAILFCDLRDFTGLSETASAEEVVIFLNTYFSDVSNVVSRYNGIINKFMGDAVLAVFGLENKGDAVEDAVRAALEIIEHAQEIYTPDAKHPETGAGIHFGSVVAGTIGSDERYEYTVIGDAVNTANRLEGLSKRLGYNVILSREAYERLSHEKRRQFSDLGYHKVRGRSEAVHVFGAHRKVPLQAEPDVGSVP